MPQKTVRETVKQWHQPEGGLDRGPYGYHGMGRLLHPANYTAPPQPHAEQVGQVGEQLLRARRG